MTKNKKSDYKFEVTLPYFENYFIKRIINVIKNIIPTTTTIKGNASIVNMTILIPKVNTPTKSIVKNIIVSVIIRKPSFTK